MNQPDTEKWEDKFRRTFADLYAPDFSWNQVESRPYVLMGQIEQFIRETRTQEYKRGREDAVAYIEKVADSITHSKLGISFRAVGQQTLDEARASDISATE